MSALGRESHNRLTSEKRTMGETWDCRRLHSKPRGSHHTNLESTRDGRLFTVGVLTLLMNGLLELPCHLPCNRLDWLIDWIGMPWLNEWIHWTETSITVACSLYNVIDGPIPEVPTLIDRSIPYSKQVGRQVGQVLLLLLKKNGRSKRKNKMPR